MIGFKGFSFSAAIYELQNVNHWRFPLTWTENSTAILPYIVFVFNNERIFIAIIGMQPNVSLQFEWRDFYDAYFECNLLFMRVGRVPTLLEHFPVNMHEMECLGNYAYTSPYTAIRAVCSNKIMIVYMHVHLKCSQFNKHVRQPIGSWVKRLVITVFNR